MRRASSNAISDCFGFPHRAVPPEPSPPSRVKDYKSSLPMVRLPSLSCGDSRGRADRQPVKILRTRGPRERGRPGGFGRRDRLVEQVGGAGVCVCWRAAHMGEVLVGRVAKEGPGVLAAPGGEVGVFRVRQRVVDRLQTQRSSPAVLRMRAPAAAAGRPAASARPRNGLQVRTERRCLSHEECSGDTQRQQRRQSQRQRQSASPPETSRPTPPSRALRPRWAGRLGPPASRTRVSLQLQ